MRDGQLLEKQEIDKMYVLICLRNPFLATEFRFPNPYN